MPAVASTDSAKPDRRRQAGVDEQQHDERDAERAACRARRRSRPSPSSADRAHHRGPEHARLGARQQHEPGDAERHRRGTASGRARRTHRATTSRKPTTRVRLVPETASRWVSPVARKSSASAGSSPASSPSTSAGTSARCSAGSPATDSRSDAAHRAGRPPPHVGPGHRRSAVPTASSTAATSGPSAAREPSGGPHRGPERHAAPVVVAPMTSTGVAQPPGAPRPRPGAPRAAPAPGRRTRPLDPRAGRSTTVPTTRRRPPGRGPARPTGLSATCAWRTSPDRRRPRRTTSAPPRRAAADRGRAAPRGTSGRRRTSPGRRPRPPAGTRRAAPASAARPRGRAQQRHPQVGDLARCRGARSDRHVAARAWPAWRRRCRRPRAARPPSVNPPCSVRHARIACAVTGPTSGSVSSSVSVGGVDVDQRPARRPPADGAAEAASAGRRRHAHQDLLAVHQHPREVEPGQVDPGPRSAGRLRPRRPRGRPCRAPRCPGRRTLPATSTVTVPAAARMRPVGRAGTGPSRPRRPAAERDERGGRASGRPAPDLGRGPPRTTHQQVTASPSATSTASTATLARDPAPPAPAASRARPGEQAAGPSTRAGRNRHHGRSVGRVRPRRSSAGTGAAERRPDARPGCGARSSRPPSRRVGLLLGRRTAASSALSSASRRETASWWSGGRDCACRRR